MKPKNQGSPIIKLQHPWMDNHNDIWLASTVSLFRNLESFKFPGKMSTDRRKQIIPLLSKTLLKTPDLSHPTFIKAESSSPGEKEYLVEHFLSNFSFQDAYSGEGFIIDDTELFLATINIYDHLHLHVIDIRGDIERAWNKLVKIETHVGKTLAYAFSQRFGFLTSNPAHCGTGLIVSLFLQPSALIQLKRIDEVIEGHTHKGVSITGLQGSPTEIIGDLLIVKNNFTLGLNEENIISSIRSFATKLLVEEGSARNEIKKNKSTEIKDQVSRAFGILMHSYQIGAIEALNAISLLKLGLELGWVNGTSTAKLNELFFHCRRGHIVRHFSKAIDLEDLPHKRAEFIHSILEGIQLQI